MTFVEVQRHYGSKKTEILFVKPKSRKVLRIALQMKCVPYMDVVEKRESGKIFLASISGKYFFWMNETVDDHWDLVK